jgi:hypothetical protein
MIQYTIIIPLVMTKPMCNLGAFNLNIEIVYEYIRR